MKEHPILFSAPMVRAILEGRKTQTRRPIKPQPTDVENGKCFCMTDGYSKDRIIKCPYGQPGDRLWVRETWAMGMTEQELYYRATDREIDAEEREEGMRWRPSIHMPRWASRITLEITDVQVERVQEISEEEAVAEGADPIMVDSGGFTPWGSPIDMPCYVDGFAKLWDSINAARGFGWDVNPWVWKLTFGRVQ